MTTDFKVRLNKLEITPESFRLIRTMDTGADAFTISFPWQPGEDPEIDEIVLPRSFAEAECEIDGQRLLTGRLYSRTPTLSVDRSEILVTCYSFTKDLIDSNALPPYSFTKVSLLEISEKFAAPFGIGVEFDSSISQLVNEQFDRLTISPEETIFNFLAKLAFQRGLLISSTVDGDIEYLQANTNGIPVANITEGDLNISNVETGQNFSATFDDSQVFATYKVNLESPVSFLDPPSATVTDSSITPPRTVTITVADETKGGLQKTANWEKNQSLAKSYSLPFRVTSWTTPTGQLWRENTIVSITSPTIFVPNGGNFLIRSVEYILDTGEQTAVLNLVLPEQYTQEQVVEPWAAS